MITTMAFILLLPLLLFAPPLPAQQPPVHLTIDAAAPGTPWQPTWNWFGADEPNYLTTPAGLQLLRELKQASPTIYFRPHNLLTTGDGTPALKWGSTDAYTEDAQGRPIYNWAITDRLFDAMVHAGVTPFVEIGFTPKALSPHPEPYQHSFPKGSVFTGWSYGPDDDAKWSALITAWVGHLHTRYGAQVEGWRWEVWNEPDIDYFHGAPQQYFHLYDITAAAVRRALPHALVGGPASTGPYGNNTFLQDFLAHCARQNAPLDFLSFHPKGSPRVVDNATGQPVKTAGSALPPNTHVQLGLANQLDAIRRGFEIVAASPRFHALPIILSESDPEGCAACLAPANSYRNGEAYAASVLEATAASLELAAQFHVQLLGAVNWSFIFPGQPPFAGFRELATALPDPAHPVLDKPVLNALRLLGELGGDQLPVAGMPPIASLLSVETPHAEIRALATRNSPHELTVLLWNYSDSLASASPTPVTLTMDHLPERKIRITQTRLDHDHANAFAAWQAMGSPSQPGSGETARLLQAAKMTVYPVSTAEGTTQTLHLQLMPNAATLLHFRWIADRRSARPAPHLQ